jgi:hypothetical protein
MGDEHSIWVMGKADVLIAYGPLAEGPHTGCPEKAALGKRTIETQRLSKPFFFDYAKTAEM